MELSHLSIPTDRGRADSFGGTATPQANAFKARIRSNSHNGSTAKKSRFSRPSPLSLNPGHLVVHLPACLTPQPLAVSSIEIQAIRLETISPDPYERLLAIIQGLEEIEKDVASTPLILSHLAKALDSLPLDMLCLLEGLPKKSSIGHFKDQPCCFLENPHQLLGHLRERIMASPRYVFTYFRAMYEKDPAQDIEICDYFFNHVLKATSCASFIDGWREVKILIEFRSLWLLLTPQQEQAVYEKVQADPTPQAYPSEILKIING